MIKNVYHNLPLKFKLIQSFIYVCFTRVFSEDIATLNLNSKIRSSEKLFIFGSGPSLNNLSVEQLNEINRHDTLSFNYSILFEGVQWKYYLVREFEQGEASFLGIKYNNFVNSVVHQEIAHAVNSNPISRMIAIVNVDWKCGAAQYFARKYLSKSRGILTYKNLIDRRKNWPPSETMCDIPHGRASLIDAINIGYILGYKELILVGVDLNDSIYFNAPDGRDRLMDIKRGDAKTVPHLTRDHLLTLLPQWHEFLRARGASLSVHNAASAAAEVLPIYEEETKRSV
ncbi:hypothetical protein OAW16_06345 [Pseudomonadales bacterium]|nr:hypothetical protein [Pseudomonadales bacterium]